MNHNLIVGIQSNTDPTCYKDISEHSDFTEAKSVAEEEYKRTNKPTIVFSYREGIVCRFPAEEIKLSKKEFRNKKDKDKKEDKDSYF